MVSFANGFANGAHTIDGQSRRLRQRISLRIYDGKARLVEVSIERRILDGFRERLSSGGIDEKVIEELLNELESDSTSSAETIVSILEMQNAEVD